MAPSHSDSGSSDSEDAPETLSLAQSKQHVKKQEDVLQQVQAAEKLKRKARNQERDRRLKEQAENSKRSRGDRDADLQARMKRAMQEAEAEMGEDGSEDDDEDEDEFRGIDGSSGAEEDKDESEEDESGSEDESDEDEEMAVPLRSKPNPNHLPDYLFEAAFSSQSTRSSLKRKAKDDVPTRKARRRTRSNASPKDVLMGSRAIRTLPQTQVPSGASTLPSAKVKKFLDRTLALKGGKSRTRGWERRPANIGVMRRDGPASSFVRKR
ncbi:hypothetical protein Hypma_004361 [Hypsizygus marmoreus]|uniref:Uncharacterized protein n=1 Tax=Hypsizygus marmoreus TaxID=39966 RepID=A0A369K3R7_HYPMA|nr:hypothetical protein Hypma_004361 [Hypsizygus marmoreus]